MQECKGSEDEAVNSSRIEFSNIQAEERFAFILSEIISISKLGR
jgi:hypothetical protein